MIANHSCRLSVPKLVALFCILLLLDLSVAKAQKMGKPFVQTYPPKVYSSAIQNWEIGQDKRGIMYFANDQGVLEYDGQEWKVYNLPNNEPVRALRVAEDGTVYIGGVNQFGYLAPNKIGALEFYSLKHLLPDTLRFEDIWSIQTTPEMVYFQTDTQLFGYRPQTQERLQIWDTPEKEAEFFLTFYVNHTLYIHTRKAGLFTLEKGKIVPVHIGNSFVNERIYSMVPLSSNQILIASREKGLYIYEKSSTGRVSLERMTGAAQDFVLENQIYSGAALPENRVVLCTRKGGAIITNIKGEILETYNKNIGLIDNNVRAAYLSTDNILWFALNNGINHASYRLPIRTWDDKKGINGTVRAIQEFGGEVYIATSLGAYILNRTTDNFEPLLDATTESWALCAFQNKLLLGTNDGVFEISGKQLIPVKTTKKAVRSFAPSLRNPQRLYVGLKGGLVSLQCRQGVWTDEGEFQKVNIEIISLIESPTEKNVLWIGTFTEGIYKGFADTEKRTIHLKPYRESEGFPSLREIHLYHWKGDLYASSSKGLFVYQAGKDRFELSPMWAQHFSQGKRGVYKILIDNQENLWIADRDTRKNSIGALRKDKKDSYQWVEKILKRLPEFSEPSVYADTKNAIWVGGSDGLFRYETDIAMPPTPPFRALIREVRIGRDSLVFGGIFARQNKQNRQQTYLQQAIDDIPAFSFDGLFEISFKCAAPFYDVENHTEFSYFLEGYGKPIFESLKPAPKWSSWTRENIRTYTNLPEGTYAFSVKARNVYGEESLVASFRFRIYAPWYRTIWAYMAYLALGAAIVYLITMLYTRNLRAQKEKLEELITERTQELVESSKKLEIQHQLLVKHNTDLNDSIDYASRIQRVMLPKLELIQAAFPDSFIFWRPLQKVSGDFYWFAETIMEPRFAKDPQINQGKTSIFKGFVEGKKIIAAIDCTGHGIPGAFMSMMGDAYLDQIVNNEGITQPQLILKELDSLIRHALKQNDGENADGMDMAMCVVNPKQNLVEFSGAKNGLIYVKAGEANIIRGDRFGIGGRMYEGDEEKIFTRHVIPIDQTTALYLYSDGLPDQFGGDKAKKFSTKRMQTFFAEVFEKSMQEQMELLEDTLQEWMKDYEQIDDILVVGLKVQVS